MTILIFIFVYFYRFKTKLCCLSIQYFNKPLWYCWIRCWTWKSHFTSSCKSCWSFSVSKLKKEIILCHMKFLVTFFFVCLKSQVCFIAVKTLSLIGQLQTETQVSFSSIKDNTYLILLKWLEINILYSFLFIKMKFSKFNGISYIRFFVACIITYNI